MFFHITSICKLNHLKTTLSLNWTVFEFIRFRFSRFLNPNTSIRKVNLKTFYASGSTHVSTRKKLSECYSLVQKKNIFTCFCWLLCFSFAFSLGARRCFFRTRISLACRLQTFYEENLSLIHQYYKRMQPCFHASWLKK